jgi:hypothetical protein
MALGYAVIAPLVLPAAVIFFFTAWVSLMPADSSQPLLCVWPSACGNLQLTPGASFHSLPLRLPMQIVPQMTWKYCALYFYERSYESGGRLFETLFKLMVGTMVG